MMNWLAELLPLFFVRWYSRKYLGRLTLGDHEVTNPRAGVFLCTGSQYKNPERFRSKPQEPTDGN